MGGFKSFFRFCVGSFVFFIIFLFSLFLFLYYFFPAEKLKPIVVEKLKEKLQVNLEIGRLSYSFKGGLSLKQLIIYEERKEIEQNPVLFSSEVVEIHFKVFPLLKKQIELKNIKIENAQLYLWQRGQSTNWEKLPFWQKKTTKSLDIPAQGKWQLVESLPEIILKNTVIHFNQKIYEISYFGLQGDRNITNVKLNLAFGLEAEAKIPLGYELKNLSQLKKLAEKPMGEGKLHFKNFRAFFLPKDITSLDGLIHFKEKKGTFELAVSSLKIQRKSFPYHLLVKEGVVFFKNKNHIWGEKIFLTVEEKSQIENLAFTYKENLESLELNLFLNLLDIPQFKQKSLTGAFQGKIEYSKNFYFVQGELKDFSLSYADYPLLAKTNIPVKMEKNHFQLEETPISLFGQQLRFKVAIKPKKENWFIEYSLRGEEFDLKEVIAKLQQISEKKPKTEIKETENQNGFFTKIMVLGSLQLKKLNYEKWHVENFVGNLALKNQILEIKPVEFTFLKGKFLGHYVLDLENWQQDFSLNFENVKPNELFETIGEKDSRWFATLVGSIKGSMQGKDSQAWEKSLRANLNLESSKGRLVKSDWQLALISGFLAPLEDRLSALEYEKAQLNIFAQEGKWFLKKAHFSSYDLAIDILGYVDWQREGELSLKLSFKDSFIRDLANPILLGIEEQKRGDWYHLPFSCQGKIYEKACWQKDW